MSRATEAFHEEVAKGLSRELLESLVSDLRAIAAQWTDGSGEQLTLMVASDFIERAAQREPPDLRPAEGDRT